MNYFCGEAVLINVEKEEIGEEINEEGECDVVYNIFTSGSYSNIYIYREWTKNSFNSMFDFTVGDIVIVKKDFDKNSNTRKMKLGILILINVNLLIFSQIIY